MLRSWKPPAEVWVFMSVKKSHCLPLMTFTGSGWVGVLWGHFVLCLIYLNLTKTSEKFLFFPIFLDKISIFSYFLALWIPIFLFFLPFSLLDALVEFADRRFDPRWVLESYVFWVISVHSAYRLFSKQQVHHDGLHGNEICWVTVCVHTQRQFLDKNICQINTWIVFFTNFTCFSREILGESVAHRTYFRNEFSCIFRLKNVTQNCHRALIGIVHFWMLMASWCFGGRGLYCTLEF